jgi:hypothetical protein
MAAAKRTEVWVRLVGAITSDSSTAVECDPGVTSFDKLTKLVKAEFKPDLDNVSAPRLMIKKNAEEYWERDENVAAAGPLGARATTPLEVEVPVASGG